MFGGVRTRSRSGWAPLPALLTALLLASASVWSPGASAFAEAAADADVGAAVDGGADPRSELTGDAARELAAEVYVPVREPSRRERTSAPARPIAVEQPAADASSAIADAPSPAPTQATPVASADVSLHENVVFRLWRGEGALTVEQRAQRASRVLSEVVETTDEDVRVEGQGERITLLVGATPVVQLTREDAALAGDATLEVYATAVATRIRAALRSERERSRIANTVFSASLVVFFGLVTLYLMRKLYDFAGRSRRFLVESPQRVPGLRLQRLEVLGPAAVRSILLLVVSLGHGLGLIGLGYTWLVLSLSLFVGTRPYVERMTGVVLSPLSGLVARVATELPMFVVIVITGGLIAVIVRIVALFFASVARGETYISWIEPDIAQATSTVVRVGLVIFALVFVGPVITGHPYGALSTTGAIILCALAIASTPLLASIVAGVALAFARAVRTGDRVEYGGRMGRVQDIGLIVLTLHDDEGGIVRVPHALSLFHPTRVLKRDPP
jgi:hypothetical protein